ncbi:hypothetical protein QVD17_41779 [Tagetes erecta]|uniref:Uncharacterized protein n=1 Tax=Tagetes erecta TaxID=13708 RepID=A0AAD8N942_TARER|nr:hypothetical protein QVD17_41779 [Tagetes erecta]
MLVQQLPPGLPLHLSMNLEALFLIHDVIVFFDVVAHKRLLGPLDTEPNVGMGSVGIPECYLVDPASSHMLVSKIKPCMCKYEQIQTVKLRMAH